MEQTDIARAHLFCADVTGPDVFDEAGNFIKLPLVVVISGDAFQSLRRLRETEL